MYYGTVAHMAPDDREPVTDHLKKYVFPDSLQGLPGLKSRIATLAENWEHSKVRWACAGRSLYAAEIEQELLETGRAHNWDHELHGSYLSLAARFQAPVVECQWGFRST